MEKSAGDFLYRELSFRALLTENSEQRSFKLLWLSVLIISISLTFVEEQLQQPLLFIADNLNFRFLINPLISLAILSVFWFGFQWTTLLILTNTLMRIGLHGFQPDIFNMTLSDLVFFGMVAQIYRTLPLSPNLRHIHAWFTFLLVVFLSASMGETANLWLSNVTVENQYHHWVQGWMTNWLNSILILPFLLLFTPWVCKLRDRDLPQEKSVYSRSGVIFSLLLLISSVLLFLFLSYSFGLNLVKPAVLTDFTPLQDFSQIVLLTLGMTAFMLLSLTYLGYYLFQHWSMTLGKKAEEAIQANDAKSRFISQMTHELRTPLNAVIGLTRLLLGSSLTSSQRDHVNNVRSSAALLNSLINELLDYSKIEANKLELEQTAFSLEDVLTRVVGVLGPRCSEKEIDFLINVSPDIPRFIVGDPLRIEQVLLNLLSNAIKFTEKGYVQLSIQLAEKHAEDELALDFSICDSGMGIEAEQLPYLFQPFQQANLTIARRFGGTGLGLMICRRLVEMMGSDIRVESTVGIGTEFTFTLRLDYRTEAETNPEAPFRCEKSWLLLHHQAEVASILSQQLLHWGGSVEQITADKTIQSWLTKEARRQEVPNLVVMMAKMGALDGVQVLRTLRIMPSWRKVPVIFLIPATQEEKYRQMVGDDANLVFLQVPFFGSLLPDAIATALGEKSRVSVSRLPQTDWQQMLTGVHVLLVEDNPINRQIAVETLQQVGIEVTVAIDGKEGIDKANQGAVDVVLMDVDLPEVDGITATYWLRNQGFQPPILAMTAYDDSKERERCLKAGMNDFMIKPFEPDSLYSLLYQWTRGKGQTQEPRLNYLPLTDKSSAQAPEPVALDVITGIARVGNNPQLYQQILMTFQNEYQDHGVLMQQLVEEENWSYLERVAHNLKSTSRYIGADLLSAEAGLLEKTLRDSDSTLDKCEQGRKLTANIHILLVSVFAAIKSVPALTQMVATVDAQPETDSRNPDKSTESLPRVLIADDELIHRQMLISLLEPECEVIAVNDGVEAVQVATTQSIDLLLLDMVMPNMRGEEVIKQLRSQPRTRDIDIIIISARNDVEDEETGFLMGATDYITKPFHPTIVKARIRNVLRLVQQRRILDQMAHLDGLTGIPNRRKFEQVLENEWSRFKNAVKPLSLAIIDVDHFKKFNDTFGHARGDEVLLVVAQTIRDVLRRTGDFVARLGGEEFVMIFSEADAKVSQKIAEQIRQAVEVIQLPVGKITVSIGGVTFIPKENLSWSALMDQADALLYEAKQGGRNQVRWMNMNH